MQIVKSNTSITVQGDFKHWKLKKNGMTTNQDLENMLKKIRGVTQTINMKCEGCSDADHCNCSIEVKRENEFNFFILLNTLDGPKWCPSSTIDSMYFNCEPDNFMKILASQVCDAFRDCPRGQDESEILCRSTFLKMLILAGARVDVSVSELYDSTYVGNPHDMISQVLEIFLIINPHDISGIFI